MHAHSLTLAPVVVLQTHSSQTWLSLLAVSAGGRYAHPPPLSHAHLVMVCIVFSTEYTDHSCR